MKKVIQIVSRFSTGVVAFAAAGYLVFAIMADNGGSGASQKQWEAASAKSMSFDEVVRTDLFHSKNPKKYEQRIDPTVTGSIRNIADSKLEKPAKRADQELTVLELIRKNADVSPGVSSGTDRVSVVVKKGDTLFGIGRRHGIGLTAIARLNGLEEPYTIKVGQTLYVAR